MTSNYLSVLVGAVAAVTVATAAQAADLNSGPAGAYGGSIKDSYAAPAPSRSFYVRVDGGYAWHGTPEIFNASNTLLDDASIGGAGLVGGGVGMYFGPRWRADLTYDHMFGAKVRGTAGPNITGGGVPNIEAEGKLTRDLFLANMYYDFDFGGRVTPYIGGGVGFAHHNFTDGILWDSAGTTGTVGSHSSTVFAAALMAGASVAITGGHSNCCASTKDVVVSSNRGLMLDVGYRFVYEGEAKTGDTVWAGQKLDPKIDDIISHELRVGLRYNIN